MGIRGHVSKSTLAKANKRRDWRIYEDFARHAIGIAQKLYVGETWSESLTHSVVRHDSALFHWVKTPSRSGLLGPGSYPDAGDVPKGNR